MELLADHRDPPSFVHELIAHVCAEAANVVPVQVTLALGRLLRLCDGSSTLLLNKVRKVELLLDDLSSADERASLLLEFPALNAGTDAGDGARDYSGDSGDGGDGVRPHKRRRSDAHPEVEAVPLTFTSFDLSSRWSAQRRYYVERKMGAWDDGHVPHEISSNPFIAHLYVELIILPAIIRLRNARAAAGLAPPSPLVVRVVEVGAGHGRLSLLLARDLTELLASVALSGNELRCQVVCTDFHGAVLQQVRVGAPRHLLLAERDVRSRPRAVIPRTGAGSGTAVGAKAHVYRGAGLRRDRHRRHRNR